MKILQSITMILGMIAMIPTFLAVPVLIVTGIIGAQNKDYAYLKKFLKIWGYSWLVIIGLLLLYVLGGFVKTMITQL